MEGNRAIVNEIELQNRHASKVKPPKDTAPFPTENNENPHLDIPCFEVSSKLTETPVKKKIKTTSFHIVRDLLAKLEEDDENTIILTSK